MMANIKCFILTTLILNSLSPIKSEYINLEGSFAEQVEQIVEHQTLREEDYAALYRAVEDIYQALKSQWPGTKLLPFGSMLTGLITPVSDVDFYVILPGTAEERTTTILLQAEKLFKQHALFTNVQEYSGEAVKVTHTPTSRELHLAFTSPSQNRNTQLVNYLLNSDKHILKLAVIIKYWSQVQNFYEQLHSYIFNMMLIFYLQQMRILPTVSELQRNVEPIIVNNWNTAFDETVRKCSCPIELFDLLVGFFTYYADFDFERLVISPYVGYPINRARFEHPTNLPRDFELYRNNVGNNLTEPIDLGGTICIQDPFDLNKNIVKHLNPILVDMLPATLRRVYDIYQVNSNPDDFLISIFKTKFN